MIFTSFEFALFFAAVVLLRHWLTNFEVEKWFLLVASYLFYMSWSLPCLGLILFTSLVDYFIGLRLGKVEDPAGRKSLLVFSLILNLGVLGYFKYTNFFLDNTGSVLSLLGFKIQIPHYDILLPAGISFFTFQSMSYTIDVYRRHLQPCQSCRDFLLFVAFFPQLVAGPIVRAADFLPQLLKRVRGTAVDVEAGLALFALGVVKKIVVSDQIAPHVEMIFANPGQFDAVTLLQGALGYTVQIYCDFSGYSDMAIGCARMMGYRFLDNFQMPYSAANITEFWRRWHISLSTWLRDYLYIPLGGNRHGARRTYVNLMLTMLLGGLWHGASWNFVVWGGGHGVALAVHKFWAVTVGPKIRRQGTLVKFVWDAISRALTLAFVVVGWILFRAHSFGDATGMIKRIMTWDISGARVFSHHIVAALIAVALTHLLVQKNRNWAEEMPGRSVPVRILAYSALLILIVCLGATDAAPFIYFQF
jgi:alginate O-acetyltransferase complex protein AlgI